MKNERRLDMDRLKTQVQFGKHLIREVNNLVLVQPLIWFSFVGIKPTSLQCWSRRFAKEFEIRLKTVIKIVLLELTKKESVHCFQRKLKMNYKEETATGVYFLFQAYVRQYYQNPKISICLNLKGENALREFQVKEILFY